MCGIIGYAGARPAAPLLLEGLERLEYRGYDSAGIAVMSPGGVLHVQKSAGRLSRLREAVNHHHWQGRVGIGHTRWATHGRPSDENAHPHRDCTGRICVVHNGIVENHQELRAQLEAGGHQLTSETDTEVIAHLIEAELRTVAQHGLDGRALVTACRQALAKVRGLYAIAVLWLDEPEVIVGARSRAPLIVGVADHGTFLASDIPAVLGHTRRVIRLGEGDLVAVYPDRAEVFDRWGRPKTAVIEDVGWDLVSAEKEGYPHFFLKEVHEQPEALERTLAGRLTERGVALPELAPIDALRVRRLVLTGCGSAYHAALMAKYVYEEWLGLPVEADIASELRYRHASFDDSVLCIAVSQSGETADTLAAFERARAGGAQRIAVTNAVGSAITTLADAVALQHSGPEVAVVASKTFTGQVATLLLVGMWLGQASGRLAPDRIQRLIQDLRQMPDLMRRALRQADEVGRIGESCAHLDRLFFLGRGIGYPTALEGALKLKEISYIQAEGYPGGELKHGPLALIEDGTPVLVVATQGATLEKLLANVEEVRARGGRIIAIATEGDTRAPQHAESVIWAPPTAEAFSPLVNVLPMQLLAYHAAVARGCDVDKPRNLAKSVTVE